MSEPAEAVKLGGVDLSVKRVSGVAEVNDGVLVSRLVESDDEVINELNDASVVAIDAPLSGVGKYRDVDRLMLKMGLKVMPANWRWMIKLSERAIRIKGRLEELGIRVIETHPWSVLHWLNMDLTQLSSKLGVRKLVINGGKDAYDAAVCALVALAYVMGKVRRVTANDGELYLISVED
ncbi:DUF429 domain-containing protein [Caldivirga maquilingensis]|uniref:DUF429 domain-containing protein n=1 Tax=Caldivirga maquilingensis (strain ATCC 700844 / DSM 13496 / JCM 10307 / IC-167) TaxID=397948 RepID=A8MBD2_CALMQ|nr:DUF429 domain-containing protein [Caldivirga maquilingensis]ABW01222.1 Protein of unknown function DUF429 [Caldivirga maquilingensis IC-167]